MRSALLRRVPARLPLRAIALSLPAPHARNSSPRAPRGYRTYATSSALPPSAATALNGTAANYLEHLYAAWLADPASVPSDWHPVFASMGGGGGAGSRPTAAAAAAASMSHFSSFSASQLTPHGSTTTPAHSSSSSSSSSSSATSLESSHNIADHLKLQLLVRAHQVSGHLLADLDPLKISTAALRDYESSGPPELDPSYYGFTPADMSRRFVLGPGILPHFRPEGSDASMTLSEILDALRKTYCSTIALEYMHITDRTICNWLRERFERPIRFSLDASDRKRTLDRLLWSDLFERFVATKFPSEKRFGLEGCEALIPGMKALIDAAVESANVSHVVIGMPHRGRLNVLTNVARKSHESIFCEFTGSIDPDVALGSGDVKYHLGMTHTRPTPSGQTVTVTLLANPSHLEAVNPVVLGKTRALQFFSHSADEMAKSVANTHENQFMAGAPRKDYAMPILLHGDAAFAGQGVVYETIGLANLPNYSVGGTIHIIVNNQIGFTTDPRFSRSTPYCSDIAKCAAAPIIHVNADDVDAVVYACRMAAEWRATFHMDVVIDIVGYRRHGHNEVDQPMFTQPLMYTKINATPRVAEAYAARLVREKVLTESDVEAMRKRIWDTLSENYERSKTYKPSPQEWVTAAWHSAVRSPREIAETAFPAKKTGAPREILQHIGAHISTAPQDFKVHSLLARILRARKAAVSDDSKGADIDMPTAEALAFGSLILQHGTHIRLSGQDVERGTFSQRHAVLHDQGIERSYTPLSHVGEPVPGSSDGKKAPIDPGATIGTFTVCNSSLSEFGVLGFELGYSLAHPNSLVVWEAQFGDFANNAQCIIDQFISSGEQKWMQRTGLVLSLPHGYDGQGPEHSSARLERFLELVDEPPFGFPSDDALSRQIQSTNMQVCYPSFPANMFHVLRRQILREFRKPLILAVSKALLRHPMARSSLADLETGAFRKLVVDGDLENDQVVRTACGNPVKDPSGIRRLVFCAGQVYYTLRRAAILNSVDDVVFARVEQIAPFPYTQARDFVAGFPNARVVWAQEEPVNMGFWKHVEPRLRATVAKARDGAPDTSTHSGVTRHMQPTSDAVLYAGRQASCAVATGRKKLHVREEHSLISEALFGIVHPVLREENGVPLFNVS